MGLANIDYGKIAQVLAPAAGALASPYQPELGAAIAGQAASLIPTNDSRRADKLAALQMQHTEQSITRNQQLIDSHAATQGYLKNEDQRAQVAEARQAEAFAKAKENVDRSEANAFLQNIKTGQGVILEQQVSEALEGALKDPVSPELLRAAQGSTGYKSTLNAMSAFAMIDDLNGKGKDRTASEVFALRSQLATLGMTIKEEKDGSLYIPDNGMGRDSNGNGKVDEADLAQMMTSLKQNLQQEYIHGAMFDKMRSDPVSHAIAAVYDGIAGYESQQEAGRSAKANQNAKVIGDKAIEATGRLNVLASSAMGYLASTLEVGGVEQAGLAIQEFNEEAAGTGMIGARLIAQPDPSLGVDNFEIQYTSSSPDAKHFLETATVSDQAGQTERLQVKQGLQDKVTLKDGIVTVKGSAFRDSVQSRLSANVAALTPPPSPPIFMAFQQAVVTKPELMERVMDMYKAWQGPENDMGFKAVTADEWLKSDVGLTAISIVMSGGGKAVGAGGGNPKDPLAASPATDLDIDLRADASGAGEPSARAAAAAKSVEDNRRALSETNKTMSALVKLSPEALRKSGASKYVRDIVTKNRLSGVWDKTTQFKPRTVGKRSVPDSTKVETSESYWDIIAPEKKQKIVKRNK